MPVAADRDRPVGGSASAARALESTVSEKDPTSQPKAERPRVNALTHRFPAENLNVLSHFYRGELARSNVWRQKMDMTTNWAIITTTAVVSVAYGNPEVTHLVLLFGSCLVFLLDRKSVV